MPATNMVVASPAVDDEGYAAQNVLPYDTSFIVKKGLAAVPGARDKDVGSEGTSALEGTAVAAHSTPGAVALVAVAEAGPPFALATSKVVFRSTDRTTCPVGTASAAMVLLENKKSQQITLYLIWDPLTGLKCQIKNQHSWLSANAILALTLKG